MLNRKGKLLRIKAFLEGIENRIGVLISEDTIGKIVR